MKKICASIIGVLLFSATLSADGTSQSDGLIAGKDFPFPSGDEGEMPEDIPAESSTPNGWEQWGQRQSKMKSSGKSEKEYIPEVENEDDGY